MTTASTEDRDRVALMALYHATNGDGWARRGGWGTDVPLSDWHGVTTDASSAMSRAVRLAKIEMGEPIPEERVMGLRLGNNQLSGPIPDALGGLTALTELDLHENQLSGPIPDALGDLTALTALNLAGNQLSGPIPDALDDLTALTFLGLSDNQLSGPIPDALGDLTALTFLGLSDNQLSGPIPLALDNLTALTYLGLSGNQLSGSIPWVLGNLTTLTYLNLSRNQLSGPIHAALGNLTALTHLYLSRNQLSGSIPDALGNLTTLTYLGLADNQLSGAIPDALGDLTALTHLDLAGNQLSWVIPDALGDLTALAYLGLANNQLSWVIPDALGDLTALTFLDLANNQLSEAIPDALGDLTALTYLGLANNQLSGAIPDALGDLTALTFLDLANNQLSEAIPAAIGGLTALTYLSLANNQLSGAIPPRLADLERVRLVSLEGNEDLEVADRPAGNRFDLRIGTHDTPAFRLLGYVPASGETLEEFTNPTRPLPEFLVADGAQAWPERASPRLSNVGVDETFHRYAVAPIDLYGEHDGAVQSQGSRLKDTLDLNDHWERVGVENLRSVFDNDTLSRLGMRFEEAYKYVRPHEFLEPEKREAYAVLFGARGATGQEDDKGQEDGKGQETLAVIRGWLTFLVERTKSQGDGKGGEDGKGEEDDPRLQLSLVFREEVPIVATDPEPGMYQRIKWAMSLAEEPPEWIGKRSPLNPPAALARAVWIWWHQRHLRQEWLDEAAGFVRDCHEQLRTELNLLRADEHIFTFGALQMHPTEKRLEGEWREHFATTTVLALDILNALDDDIPLTLGAMKAEEFGHGVYRKLMRTHLRLRAAAPDDSDPSGLQQRALDEALEEIAGIGREGMSAGTLASLDLETVRRGLERHLAMSGPLRSEGGARAGQGVAQVGSQPRGATGFGLDWHDLEDDEHHHALVAVEADTATLTTSRESHVLEMAALEIALHSVASEFAAASGAILENHQSEQSEERDKAEDDLLDSLSDQLLRVTRWRTQLTGWPRAMYERLQATSRLDENIQAFYDASRESVQRAQIRRQKDDRERESNFQRVVTVAGVAFAAVVLGEITISIGQQTEVGNTVALLLGAAAALFGVWLAWALNDDSPRLEGRFRTGLVLLGKGGLAALTFVMLADYFDWLSIPHFREGWWPWPGLPLLGAFFGATSVILFLWLLRLFGFAWSLKKDTRARQ